MLCKHELELARANLVIPIAPSCRASRGCTPKHFANVAWQLLDERPERELPTHERAGSCVTNPVQDLAHALETTNGSDVIISAEGFDRLDNTSVAALVDMLSRNFEPHVVIVYRDKLRHLLSYYAELNQHKTPPVTFQDFYWSLLSDMDTLGEETPPSKVCMGLFLSSLVRTYGQHVGMDRFIIINYDAAGDKLWQVFLESLSLPGVKKGERHAAMPAGTDSSNKDQHSVPERVNESPEAFVLTVAAQYYAARWGLWAPARWGGGLRGVSPTHRVWDNVARRWSHSLPLPGIPATKCTARLLAAAAKKLPKQCTSLANIVQPWAREERRTLESLRKSGSHLVLFDDGPAANKEPATTACDIDFQAVQRLANCTNRADALLWFLNEASREIDEKCTART
jgi:hypothetical protein